VVTKTWLRLAIPAVLLAFGATACSGDNTKQLDAWAVTLCGGMQTPVQQADAALADTGTVRSGETPAALQTRLAADLGTLSGANSQIAQAVQKAGAPKVDNGAKTQASAIAELTQAANGYTSVQQAVAALPVSDQAKFAAGLKGVGDKLQQLAELSTSALQQLQAGDLGTALAKQPGCKSVKATAETTPAPGSTGTPSGTATASPSGSASGAAPGSSGSASASAKPSGTATAKAGAGSGAGGSADPSASGSTS
jgi:hypothetical protein